MKIARLCLVIAVVVIVSSAFAAAKPNFTGTWKLNAAKSEFGGMPAPSKMEQKIVHGEPNLSVTLTFAGDFGEFTDESKYTTDGKECVNTSQMGPSKSTAIWEGDTLVIVRKMDMQGSEITITNKWSLSADGKSLTIDFSMSGPQGEGTSKFVMDKE